MATLAEAVRIAEKSLDRRFDQAGEPLLLHSLRVMLRLIRLVRKAGQPLGTAELPIVAVLHEVVEEGGVTLEDLRVAGFGESILDAVDRLTKPGPGLPVSPGEYPEGYLDRIKGSPTAVRVKLADLEDNLNLRRRRKPGHEDFVRADKDRRAYDELRGRRRVS